MGSLVANVVESSATHAAGERFLPGVENHVALQVGLVGKLSPT